MKALYTRVSSLEQRSDRQLCSSKDYDILVEDKCSGAIPFFERPGGTEISKLIKNGILKSLSIYSIDRAGRDLRDIINTIYFFNEKKIPIHFISQGITTLDDTGKENPISKMVISMLGIVAEMERVQIKERQREGIRLAKLKGVYKGRTSGSSEDVFSFLSKPKNKKVLEYLKKGYKATEVAKLAKVHYNTVVKVKALGLKPAA